MIIILVIIDFINSLTNAIIKAERFINEREKDRDRIVKSFQDLAAQMTKLNNLSK